MIFWRLISGALGFLLLVWVPVNAAETGNRLAGEESPYLRLHAKDPVHWRPWGRAAFEAARAQGKLIYLSIGYLACHWCHVMQRDNHQNQTTADLMN